MRFFVGAIALLAGTAVAQDNCNCDCVLDECLAGKIYSIPQNFEYLKSWANFDIIFKLSLAHHLSSTSQLALIVGHSCGL